MQAKIQAVVRIRNLVGGEALPFQYTDQEIEAQKLSFAFDHVYGPTATTDEIYAQSVEWHVKQFLQGFPATIFAYGQSGSGKTFTMMEGNGVMAKAVQTLFALRAGARYKASVIEIYNESIRDLLDPSQTDLRIMEVKSQMVVEGAVFEELQRPADFQQLLDRAIKNRAVGTTNLNVRSSRSHLLVVIQTSGDGERIFPQLTLVDLAGSERISKTGAQGTTLQQAGSINSSLLVLGRVINSILKKDPHISYRDSKLTRLLHNSLGGNASSLLIVCISSQTVNIEETIQSLRFGVRCAQVVNVVRKQVSKEDERDQILAQLREELQQKEAQIVDLLQANDDLETKYVSLKQNLKTQMQGIIDATNLRDKRVRQAVQLLCDEQKAFVSKIQVAREGVNALLKSRVDLTVGELDGYGDNM